MSKTNYTPAPWYVLSEGVTDAAIGYRAIIDADGYTVCNPSPMGEANARLIAAAPELLEALKVAESELRYHAATRNSEALTIVRAAIQKATGGEQ